ncbi:23S rRNA (guanosine(2251)-2'-O)-methyltransferase RlmB [soil metagenome]
MAGNSKRRGAVKRTGKGNPTSGSGGRVRRGLEGKGPTPKATERPGHKAYRPAAAANQTSARPRRTGGGRRDDSEWVAGRNAVVEALRGRVPVQTIYVAEHADRDDRLREVFAFAAEHGTGILEVSKSELDRRTGGAVHQGVAAKVPAYDYAHPDDLLAAADEARQPPLVVALDGITDPRNLGAVVRSAAGFGAHGVVVPERRSAGMSAGAWKSSAGAAARLPVARATNLARQLAAYRDAGLMVAGLAADGEVPVGDLEIADGPLVLVVGSEGAGMSRLVGEACDVTVSIPMASTVESLNAGVAAGVALYAVARRRGQV